ncbi:MAG: F0F1 ATP synthase subunit gamma, partial [Alphaproteobacteria bacterium]|nr:F0F1 ATP synthase subunit gamma [Alphaproteobacteria bacterium]
VLNDALQKPHYKSKSNRILAVLIGTDNGLVGKFNRDVLTYAEHYFQKQNIDTKAVEYVCIGKRLGAMTQNAVEDRLHGTFAISNSLKEIASIASSVLMKINDILSHKETTQVLVFYNHRPNGQIQTPTMAQLMPLPYEELLKFKKQKWEGKSFPMIPEDRHSLILRLMLEYLTVVLSGGLTASLAAEHYARMVNMQQAEKNIDKSLEDMNLAYQQARQTQITDELIDIVSGAEAMRPKKNKTLS